MPGNNYSAEETTEMLRAAARFSRVPADPDDIVDDKIKMQQDAIDALHDLNNAERGRSAHWQYGAALVLPEADQSVTFTRITNEAGETLATGSAAAGVTTGKVETVKNVDHPRHYNVHPSGVECIDVVQHMNFNVGNAMKYLWRSDHKNGLEDLKKAVWYITKEIERREAAQQVLDTNDALSHITPRSHVFLGGNPSDPDNWAPRLNAEG